MPAVDDYAPPAPLWLVVVAAALALDAGRGVSGTALALEVQRRMPGRFRRMSSVFDVCARMLDDGMLHVVRVVQIGAARATFYAATDNGREMFFEARGAAELALCLSDVRDTKPKQRKPT